VCSEATSVRPTRKGRSLKDEAKPFCISRWEVWEAYLKVKSNQGAAGLDGQSIADFERGLKKNLYRIVVKQRSIQIGDDNAIHRRKHDGQSKNGKLAMADERLKRSWQLISLALGAQVFFLLAAGVLFYYRIGQAHGQITALQRSGAAVGVVVNGVTESVFDLAVSLRDDLLDNDPGRLKLSLGQYRLSGWNPGIISIR
jgi:hypothetical protein